MMDPDFLEVFQAILEPEPTRFISDNLIMLQNFRQNINVDPHVVLKNIIQDIPTTTCTIDTIIRRKNTLLLCAAVPVWFHEILMGFGHTAEANDPILLQTLINGAPDDSVTYRHPTSLQFIAKAWINHCVRPSLVRSDQGASYCAPGKAWLENKLVDAMILSPEIFDHFLTSLCVSESFYIQRKAGMDTSNFLPDFDLLFPSYHT
jgi:hypothetical protein